MSDRLIDTLRRTTELLLQSPDASLRVFVLDDVALLLRRAGRMLQTQHVTIKRQRARITELEAQLAHHKRELTNLILSTIVEPL